MTCKLSSNKRRGNAITTALESERGQQRKIPQDSGQPDNPRSPTHKKNKKMHKFETRRFFPPDGDEPMNMKSSYRGETGAFSLEPPSIIPPSTHAQFPCNIPIFDESRLLWGRKIPLPPPPHSWHNGPPAPPPFLWEGQKEEEEEFECGKSSTSGVRMTLWKSEPAARRSSGLKDFFYFSRLFPLPLPACIPRAKREREISFIRVREKEGGK